MDIQEMIDIYNNMPDEEFYNLFAIGNIFTNYNSTYSYLSLNENTPLTYVTAVAEKKYNEFNPVGKRLLKITTNSSETSIRRTLEIMYNKFTSGEITSKPEFLTLSIDGPLLENDQVIEFLQRCINEEIINELVIIGDDYVLNEETFNKLNLNNLFRISVANSEVNNYKISVTNPNYRIIEGLNSNTKSETNAVIINENIPNIELAAIIETLNNINKNKMFSTEFNIELRFENPKRTVEIIKKLEEYGLDEKIGIKILGYPLTENADLYKELIPIVKKRQINVTYACCHDLIGLHTNEPFLVENSYKSELEPDGKTDLLTYIKILEFLEGFENKVDGIDSNIEKIMTAYQYLNDNYYYDLYAGDNKADGATRDVDKILDTNQIVCVGYANLLSIMCRRIGIPMFTYSAPKHELNIARVLEKDKNGNVIFDKICTFDATNDSGYEDLNEQGEVIKVDNKDSYTFFGLDPESELHFIDEESFLTLANILAIHPKDISENKLLSASPYQSAFNSFYSPENYLYPMLHLMGYNYDETTINPYDVIGELQEQGRIGEIPKDLVMSTARNIERRKHPEMSEKEFNNYMNDVERRINNSIERRNAFFDKSIPARINKNIISSPNENSIVEVKTYSMEMPHHEQINIEEIDMGPVYYQEQHNTQTKEPIDNKKIEEIDTKEQIIEEPTVINNSTNEQEIPQEQIVEEPTPSTIEPEPSIDVIDSRTIEEPEINTDQQIQTIDINSLIGTGGNITINGNVHIKGNVNITINNYGQDPVNLSNVTIAGTTVRKPKKKQQQETIDDYNERIDSYYEEYLPKALEETNTTYRLTRNQIGQDLPIYSKEEQVFNAIGMTDEEIEESRRKLR